MHRYTIAISADSRHINLLKKIVFSLITDTNGALVFDKKHFE